MESEHEPDARDAAQGLLDFANTATSNRPELPRAARSSETGVTTSSGRDALVPAQASGRPVVPSARSGLGRIITSGLQSLASRPSQDGALKQGGKRVEGQFRQPAPRRPEAQERVTVIVHKAPGKDDKATADVPAVPCDVPVPASVFAPLIGSGDSGKSSADFTPFSATIAVKEASGSDEETESDEKPEDSQGNVDEETQRPLKKRRMTRTVSINTVLQRVGSKEALLSDSIGAAPQTVQEMIPHIQKAARTGSGKADAPVDTLEIVEKLWGPAATPKGPSLPPRKSSDQSTIDQQRAFATTRLSGPTDAESPAQQQAARGLKRELSAECGLHFPPKPPAAGAKGLVVETGAAPAGTKPTNGPRAGAKDLGEEAAQSALWTGRIKHFLRTTEGTSIVELFDLTALVPAKLLEQLPPTVFVSALAGRANVKLGKHFVTQCRLSSLSERQKQKALALAAMRLVAICELQHCSLTLVPYTNSRSELRIVGFMIADE